MKEIKLVYSRNGEQKVFETDDYLDLIEHVALEGVKDEEFESLKLGDEEISGGINGLAIYALRNVKHIRDARKAAVLEDEEYDEFEDECEDECECDHDCENCEFFIDLEDEDDEEDDGDESYELDDDSVELLHDLLEDTDCQVKVIKIEKKDDHKSEVDSKREAIRKAIKDLEDFMDSHTGKEFI